MNNSILKTLAWFDIFDTPLTAEELYRWLWQPNQNPDYATFLKDLAKITNVETKDSYHTLAGRDNIIETRQTKIPLIEQKIKIALKAAKKIRWVPFVQAVFVANTVATGSATAKSDIDIFIVVREGRIYLSRFLVTILLTIFRLKRNKKCISDRVCLCFYATEAVLDLSKIKIAEPDIYLTYWIDQLLPIYDPHKTHEKIIQQNQWVKNYLPNALKNFEPTPRWQVKNSKLSLLFKSFFEKAWQSNYGNFIESQSKQIQQQKMKSNTKSIQNENDNRVIINDNMLKFHENDRRTDYKNQWQEKYKSLIKYDSFN